MRYLLDTHPCMSLAPPPARVGGPGLARPADAAALRAAVSNCYAAARKTGGGGGGGGADGAGAAAAAAAVEKAAAAEEEAPAAAKGAAAAAPDCQFPLDADVRQSGAWLSDAEAALVQRFDPAGPLDTIGFFAARFVKAAAAP